LRPAIRERKKGFDDGLQGSLLRGNLVDMAVGIVIGIAFAAVVTALAQVRVLHVGDRRRERLTGVRRAAV
jgi:hypothetical protein